MRFKEGQRVRCVAINVDGRICADKLDLADPLIVPIRDLIYTVGKYNPEPNPHSLSVDEIPLYQQNWAIWWEEEMFEPIDELEEPMSDNLKAMLEEALRTPMPVTRPIRKREPEPVSECHLINDKAMFYV